MRDSVRLKWLLSESDVRAGVEAEDLPLLSVSISWGVRRREATGAITRAASENLSNYKICRAGDLVINRMRAFQGALGIAPEDGIVSPDYAVLRVDPNINSRWLNYFLTSGSTVATMASLVRGIGGTEAGNVRTPRLNIADLLSIVASRVSAEEQRVIADYLDRETARIDTLIEEQQRLIEMLRERRQAIIDVTFSVLGEPCVQLRRYIRFLTSGSRGWADYYADEGERFVRIGNLPRVNLDLRGDVQFVDLPANVTEGSRTMLESGDLLFSITAYLGSVAVVGGDWVGAYVSQHVALCRLESEHVNSRFIGWFMLTTKGQDQLKEGAAGGAKMQLALDDIRGLRVPLAPINQQRSIAASLDEQTAKIDMLIAETERFIELSRERRSALITAAVTGHLDVREGA
ncbi:restriction endonuclease subunit S [Streptomyces sp. NPDC101115]|uniref:restriction endonuclease subunit S n=1 Tax=Streptomyces sp. NPDC101115 TaxID=3366106 RepID=UPI0037FE82D0